MPNSYSQPKHEAELLDELSRLAAVQGKARKLSLRIRVLLVQQGEEWNLFAGHAVFFPQGHESSDRLEEYPGLILAEQWFSGSKRSLEALNAILTGEGQVAGISVRATMRSTGLRRNLRPHNLATGWPNWETSLSISRDQPVSLPHGAIVARGRPAFTSSNHAYEEWIRDRGDYWDGGGSTESQEFYIVLPDRRGRIHRAEWRDDHISVEMDLAVRGCELHCVFRKDRGLERIRLQRLSSKHSYRAPAETQRMKLLLVGPDNSLLHSMELSAEDRRYSSEDASIHDLCIEDIQNGEREDVEFKPFIKPRHQKEQELIYAITALANNANGGRLYVGVRNDGQLDGEEVLRKYFSAPTEAATLKAIAWLRGLANEHTEPVPVYAIHPVHFAAGPVLMMVIQGSGELVQTRRGEIRVRRGASSMAPNRDDLYRLFDEGPGLPLSAVFRPRSSVY